METIFGQMIPLPSRQNTREYVTCLDDWRTTVISSNELEDDFERNIEEWRSFIRQWAAYVREHDAVEWSRQQNGLINSQIQRANELAKEGEIDSTE